MSGTRNRLMDDGYATNVDENVINDQVNKLIREGYRNGNIPFNVIQDLRRKYNDDQIIDKIQDAYYDKMSAVRRRALKFTKLIEKKYGVMGYPLHVVLNKALKYKKKYNLSDPEYEIFRQTYEKNLNTRNKGSVNILAPNTNMAKVFGDPSGDQKLLAGEGEYRTIKEIIVLYETHRPVYSQLILQSLQYDGEAEIPKNIYFNNSYDRKTDFGASYIHPVIAAMFLPKISKFDNYFLLSNLAYIVKLKQNGEPIDNYNNYILLYNLVTEPTDVVCSYESPLIDIRNRITLQFSLYKNVLALREGKFYDTHLSQPAAELMTQIDYCRISNADAPDLMMIGDESVVLRRLLNAFAFRSIVVATSPIATMTTHNAINLPIVATNVMKVPMLYVRLPAISTINSPNLATGTAFGTTSGKLFDSLSNAVDLKDILNSTSIAYYNNTFQPRLQSVIHADGALIFNIPRRTYQPLMAVQNMFNPPNFTNLPQHVYGLERINEHPIKWDDTITIGNSKKFCIRSAVVLKTKELENDDKTKYIIGTKAYIWMMNDPNKKLGDACSRLAYIYDPAVDSKDVKDRNDPSSIYKDKILPLRAHKNNNKEMLMNSFIRSSNQQFSFEEIYRADNPDTFITNVRNKILPSYGAFDATNAETFLAAYRTAINNLKNNSILVKKINEQIKVLREKIRNVTVNDAPAAKNIGINRGIVGNNPPPIVANNGTPVVAVDDYDVIQHNYNNNNIFVTKDTTNANGNMSEVEGYEVVFKAVFDSVKNDQPMKGYSNRIAQYDKQNNDPSNYEIASRGVILIYAPPNETKP